MSEALKSLDGIDWLHKREAVPRNTPTLTFNQDAKNVRCTVRIKETSNRQGGSAGVGVSRSTNM